MVILGKLADEMLKQISALSKIEVNPAAYMICSQPEDLPSYHKDMSYIQLQNELANISSISESYKTYVIHSKMAITLPFVTGSF